MKCSLHDAVVACRARRRPLFGHVSAGSVALAAAVEKLYWVLQPEPPSYSVVECWFTAPAGEITRFGTETFPAK